MSAVDVDELVFKMMHFSHMKGRVGVGERGLWLTFYFNFLSIVCMLDTCLIIFPFLSTCATVLFSQVVFL